MIVVRVGVVVAIVAGRTCFRLNCALQTLPSFHLTRNGQGLFLVGMNGKWSRFIKRAAAVAVVVTAAIALELSQRESLLEKTSRTHAIVVVVVVVVVALLLKLVQLLSARQALTLFFAILLHLHLHLLLLLL